MSATDTTLFLNVVHDLRITNGITIASLVVLIYDILLTFPEEVEYVWNAKWTYGKFIFFLNRYPVVVVSVILVVGNMDVASDLKMLVLSPIRRPKSTLAFIVPVQLIFCLRTTALWDRSRRILVFLIFMMIASDIVIGIFIWMAERGGRFMLPRWPELRDLLGCYSIISDQASPNVIVPAVAALMVFDAAILILTIWRFVKLRRDGEGNGSLMRILFRDGVLYYIVVFAASAANLIMYAVLPEQHNGLGIALVPLLRTTVSICASRLMLNLRDVIMGRVKSTTWSRQSVGASVYVQTRNIGSNSDKDEEGDGDVMEMRLRSSNGADLTYPYRYQVEYEMQSLSSSGTATHSLFSPHSATLLKDGEAIKLGQAGSTSLESRESAMVEGEDWVHAVVFVGAEDCVGQSSPPRVV